MSRRHRPRLLPTPRTPRVARTGGHTLARRPAIPEVIPPSSRPSRHACASGCSPVWCREMTRVSTGPFQLRNGPVVRTLPGAVDRDDAGRTSGGFKVLRTADENRRPGRGNLVEVREAFHAILPGAEDRDVGSEVGGVPGILAQRVDADPHNIALRYEEFGGVRMEAGVMLHAVRIQVDEDLRVIDLRR